MRIIGLFHELYRRIDNVKANSSDFSHCADRDFRTVPIAISHIAKNAAPS